MSDKKKDDQPAPFQGEFSFVNKDAGNIDSKDHNAAVTWHVMNRYERWKKHDQAKRLRASANVPRLSGSSTSQGSSRRQSQTQLSEIPRTRTSPRIQYATAGPLDMNPWMVEQPFQVGYPSTQASGSGLPLLSYSTFTDPASLDDSPTSGLGLDDIMLDIPDESPVDTFGLPTTPLAGVLMSFAYEFFIPRLWPKETAKVQHTYEIARSRDDVAATSDDGCYANALFSLLAGSLSMMNEDQSLATQSKSFRTSAMKVLRQQMNSPGSKDTLTLKAALKLFSAESINDNTSVARAHLKLLRKLIVDAGGVILLDSWFREDLLSCDCYFALKYETRPLFPVQDWTPGPLSQPWRARLVSAGILGDHATKIDQSIEHVILRTAIADLRELFRAEEYIQTHEISGDDQLLRWGNLRKFDCISRIADHHVNVTIYPHLFNRSLTQAFICTATSLMTNMVLGSPEPVRLGLKLLETLFTKVTESESEGETYEQQRLCLWAAYVGGLATAVHPTTVKHRDWFKQQVARYASELKAEKWEDKRRVLKFFLFSERLHEEIKSGPSYRVMDPQAGYYAASGCSWREPRANISATATATSETETGMGKKRASDG